MAESRAWAFFVEHSSPRPETQYLLASPGGEIVARLDFAWPLLKVFLAARLRGVLFPSGGWVG